jgi:TRAP-type C4-dicarboxylate transport system permease small subunit
MSGPEPMVDAPADERTEIVPDAQSPLQRAVFALGVFALAGAMATDAIAVAGRHLGVALLGSIEVMQALIVLLATSAMVMATLVDGHARVRIVLEKVSQPAVLRLERLSDVASAVAFIWLALGSIWLAHDLWSGAEVTEILNLPLRWLRVVWIAGCLVIAVLFLSHARSRGR